MTEPETPARDDGSDHDGASSDHDVAGSDHGADSPSRAPRRPRPGYHTPEPAWSQRMGEWSPLVAAMLRTTVGLVAFVGVMLAMPVHIATPFLVGMSLLMVVGGANATLNVTRDDLALRKVGRVFTLVTVLIVLVSFGIAAVVGVGAYAPRIEFSGPPAPVDTVDDGTIRFESGP
jgi:hypothetical protein